jgi:hypothetical protein
MIESLREQFNHHFSRERYDALVHALSTAANCTLRFRIAESPIFLSREFVERAARSAEDILLRAASPELQKIGEQAIPSDFRYASETTKPLFAAVDFAITGTREAPEIKLIELQGFPSLYHFQAAIAQLYREAYGLPNELNGLCYAGDSYESYYATLKDAIVGENDPAEVALVELSPYNQKTLPDFLLAQKQLGIAIVDIASVEADHHDLFYRDMHGKRHPIRRIYNRAIRDEIVRTGAHVPFDVSKEYKVTWAGHPNWFFRISKVLLPHLTGVNDAVPKSMLLSEANVRELDLSKYVLKPLYSFAGAGVVIGPTRDEIEAISSYAREHWLLQERVTYSDIFQTPDGSAVRGEMRMLMIWPEADKRPKAWHTLVRLTRGDKIGVDQNKDLEYTGSSAALIA